MLLRILLGIAAVVVVFWVIGLVLKLLWLAVVVGVIMLAVLGLTSVLKGSKSESQRH